MIKKNRLLIIGIVLLLIAGVICRYSLLMNGYATISTSTNGEVEEYIVKSYKEQDGCVTFVDVFGFEKKFCGFYTITKLNK